MHEVNNITVTTLNKNSQDRSKFNIKENYLKFNLIQKEIIKSKIHRYL